MPRSRSVATEPIARMMAAKAPNWARFFQSWRMASSTTGSGIWKPVSWSPPAALTISGRNFASRGEVSPTTRKRPPTTGSRRVRHDSSSSLRRRIRKPAIRPPPRRGGRRPGRPGAGRRPRTTVGRVRTRPAGRPAATTIGNRPADPAASSVTDTVTLPAASVTRSIHGVSRRTSTSVVDRCVLARLRVEPIERQRVADAGDRPTVPRSPGGRGRGSRPGRRSARRRTARASRR